MGFRNKSQSRIIDSDDEDDAPKPSKWRSRFAEDSDDEPDTHFTPVRGIPRLANDSDSTDLEDSSDEEKAPPRTPPPKLALATNNVGSPGAEALSPNTQKKRGIFGRFRGKKAKEGTLSPMIESPQAASKPDSTKPSQLGFSSAAERDRIIAQTQAKLEQAQHQQQVVMTPPSSSHGKLQRRHIPQRVMSDSWPLPPKIPDDVDSRPGTAESAPVHNGSTRLNKGSLRGQIDLPPAGRSGKKKRFPMLRKAFGLKD